MLDKSLMSFSAISHAALAGVPNDERSPVRERSATDGDIFFGGASCKNEQE